MALHYYLVEAYIRTRGSLKSYNAKMFKVQAENDEKARNEVRVICASQWLDIQSFGLTIKEKDPADVDR